MQPQDMANYEICPVHGLPVTNHSEEIADLRWRADHPDKTELEVAALHTAADLLERHDECEISLNRWTWPGALVSLLIGRGVLKNDLHPVFPDEVD